jgi:hypothetical protein
LPDHEPPLSDPEPCCMPESSDEDLSPFAPDCK